MYLKCLSSNDSMLNMKPLIFQAPCLNKEMGHKAPAPLCPLGWNEEVKLSLARKGAVVRYFYFCLCSSPPNSISNWQ